MILKIPKLYISPSNTNVNRFFSKVYNPSLATYHVTCRDLKRQHFESMKNLKSSDPELRKKGALRILEIGPGPGYNFEFYPPNSELTVVEVNPFFEDQFFEKQVVHPHIKMDRFVVGFAEDMKGVPDNSIDVVVSTMVLCSVRSVDGALKEVHRVLAPVSDKSNRIVSIRFNRLIFVCVCREGNIIIGSTSVNSNTFGFDSVSIYLPTHSTTWCLVAV